MARFRVPDTDRIGEENLDALVFRGVARFAPREHDAPYRAISCSRAREVSSLKALPDKSFTSFR
jgi:hypothetical protein